MLDAHLNAQRGVDTSLVSMRSGDAEGEGHRAQCHGELATSAMDTARDFESIRGSTYSFQMYRSGASPASAHRQNPTPPGSGRSSLRSPGQVPEASPAPPGFVHRLWRDLPWGTHTLHTSTVCTIFDITI